VSIPSRLSASTHVPTPGSHHVTARVVWSLVDVAVYAPPCFTLSRPDAGANHSAMRPRVGCFTAGQLLPHLCAPLGHPIPSLTEASRRPATLIDRCQGCCATTMPTPSTRRQGLAQRLCFLLPCWHHGRASSRSQPSYLGACRHRVLARPCAPHGHDQHPPCLAHHPDAGIRTKFPPHVCPSQRPLSLCLYVT
jgi:hypothetical protein